MAPSSDAQGSSLSDLAGYKIYVGQVSKTYTRAIDVGNSTSTVIGNLSEGQWCFSVTAYDTSGNESGFSNELCKII
jgi:chitodextrinase